MEEPEEARKHVTLLFSDLVGSTALADCTDPETVRRVVSRYFDEVRRVLEAHGGTLEKFVGDAVMAVFGIPVVHEDDALRAVRAAAEIRDRVERLNAEFREQYGVELSLRTGVNTGEVIAGTASAGEAFATGDAVNVAARLEQTAAPGEILLGEATLRLVRDAVAVESVGSLNLKGKSETVPAWRLLAVEAHAPGVARRLDVPLVGREREFAALREALRRVEEERRCHLVSVLGAPGAGKSRLIAEFSKAASGHASVVTGTCLPYGEGITFWPIVEMVTLAAGIDEADAPDVVKSKVAVLVARDEQGHAIADHLAPLLGAGAAGGALRELFWAVRKLFETLAVDLPLIVVFDDVHWAEPSLLDLLEYVLGWSSGAPILLICNARQDLLETRPSLLAPRPSAASIVLEPLDRQTARQLVGNLVIDSAGLPAESAERIVEAAEGNPLFLEEIVRMLAEERGLNGDPDSTGFAIPATIHALLAARLDRLEQHERDLLERAAVIGRTFWWGALARLSPAYARAAIPSSLQSLVRKDLIAPDPQAFAGEDAFRFGHQLIRDTAYGGLAKEKRADLHERFASWLEEKTGERLAEYQEILGYHLEEAWRYRTEIGGTPAKASELAARAAAHVGASGRRALARGDVHAAANLLGRAAVLLPLEHADRVAVLLDAAKARSGIGDLAGVRVCLDEAAAAARTPQEDASVRIEYLLFQTNVDPSADLDELMRACEEARPLFERAADDRGLFNVWIATAEVHLTRCRWSPTIDALERALAHVETGQLSTEHVYVLTHLANALFWGPTPVDEAIDRCTEILSRAEGYKTVEANVRSYLGGLAAMKGDFDEARRLIADGRAIFADLGHQVGLANQTVVGGPVELLAGDPHAAARVLAEARDRLAEMGETGVQSSVAALLAAARLECGDAEGAEREASAAEALAADDDVASQVVLRATKGRLLARRGAHGAGEELARDAVRRVLETDFLDLQGSAFIALAEVLEISGDTAAWAAQVERAVAAFEEKGNIVRAAHARRLLEAEPDPG